MPEHPANTTQSIRRYYEQNTRLFFSLGGSSRAYSIHRALWMDGVATLDDALLTCNRLLLAEAQSVVAVSRLHLVDLGCGIGGTLFYLLERLQGSAIGVGLTISPLQAQLARRRSRQLALDGECLFVEADFLASPLALGSDMVYSVEAFVHAASPQRYFDEAARLLRPGGRLVLVDDFLAESPAPAQSSPSREPAPQRWLEAYRQGWHVPNLCTAEQAIRLAEACSLHLRQETDLTPHLRLRTLPEGLASLLLKVGKRLPVRHAILPSMLGSLALQQCLKMGWISYRLLSFEKQG
jgi:cyclopropane fatty-acyl-phospholipid synthase-like methyltransferase